MSRIERLLLTHPKYIRKFDLFLKEINADILQQRRRVLVDSSKVASDRKVSGLVPCRHEGEDNEGYHDKADSDQEKRRVIAKHARHKITS